jgi:hypothetical protein
MLSIPPVELDPLPETDVVVPPLLAPAPPVVVVLDPVVDPPAGVPVAPLAPAPVLPVVAADPVDPVVPVGAGPELLQPATIAAAATASEERTVPRSRAIFFSQR